MVMKYYLCLAGLFFCWMLDGRPAAAENIKAFVSIAPQQYFVQQIGKDRVDVSVLVPPGFNAHTYEPKPRQMADLAKATVFFAVGIEFEKAWMQKIAATHPGLKVVQTDTGIQKIALADHHHHDHGKDRKALRDKQRHTAEHTHEALDPAGTLDPHIWLSPPLVRIQAEHIRDALVALDPANRMHYEANFSTFIKDIDELDGELKTLFSGNPGARFMVFHPSWGYFAQAYGLEQVPIEIEGKDPKPAQLKELIRQAKEQGIKVIFVQPQFSAKSAEMVSREIGGQVVTVDPLAGNWAENLREVGRKFKAALR
jgi:zinc transport system substrate-binding protein